MSQSSSQRRALSRKAEEKGVLDALVVEHGPIELLGLFVLAADEAIHTGGLTANVAPLDTLVEANNANAKAWRPMLPVLVPELAGFAPEDAFAIVVRNSSGEVVATNACRRFDWSSTTMAVELESMRFFYENPARDRRPGERCIVSAPSADSIGGEVVYFGGSWCHPDYRGRALSGIVSRLGKAFALARWPLTHGVGLMLEEVYRRGFAHHLGFADIEWDIKLINSRQGDKSYGLLCATPDDIASDLAMFLASLGRDDGGTLGHSRAKHP
jgi:hypothetical protein